MKSAEVQDEQAQEASAGWQLPALGAAAFAVLISVVAFLFLGRPPIPAPSMPGRTLGPAVQCPGSSFDTYCTADMCCPGVAATEGLSFPCPIATDFTSCETDGVDPVVSALLAAMYREEKYRFTRGVGWEDNWDPHANFYIGNAAGQQRFGIPSQNMQDSGNGFRNNLMTLQGTAAHDLEQVTSFPVALAVASIWSEAYMLSFGEALGEEFRKKGANVLLGPAVNVHRTPQGGRNAEYISGESGYLGARLTKPYIRGVQSKKVLASVKHFINNNQENCRRSSNSIVDERTRWEVYYPPFEAAVQADVAAQMCGYNQVNGEWNCNSHPILVGDLKGTMGFKGWVQSDWWANPSFDSVNNGIDQEMPGTATPKADYNDCTPDYDAYFTDANLNTLTDTKLDSMLRPQLTMMLKYGLFEKSEDSCNLGSCSQLHYDTVVATDESKAFAKELATRAVILLKNDGAVLPIPTSGSTKIALLGSACNLSTDIDFQLQDWKNRNYYFIGGSGRIIAKKPITILDGLTEKCQEYGCTVVTELADDFEAAIDLAKDQDYAIFCGGVSSTEELDRPDLTIVEEGYILNVSSASALASVKKIVLTMTAGTIVMPWISAVDSALNVFLPGKYAGSALADNLFGISNPSAKSPVAWPVDESKTIQPCPCEDGVVVDCEYTEKLFISWHGMEADDILFPFGHGLSYTVFSYSGLSIESSATCDQQDPDRGAVIACWVATVTNSGSLAGIEVAQLYLGFPDGTGEPAMQLRGFHRTASLGPMEAEVAKFPLYQRDVQIYTVGTGWEQPSGTFTVYVGSSAGDTPLSMTWDVGRAAFAL